MCADVIHRGFWAYLGRGLSDRQISVAHGIGKSHFTALFLAFVLTTWDGTGVVYAQELNPNLDVLFAQAFDSRNDDGVVARGSFSGRVTRHDDDESDDDEGYAAAMHAATYLAPGELLVADLQLKCDTSYCDDPEHVEALLRATGLEVGKPTNTADLKIATERLRKTGFFSHIQQDVRQSTGGISVVFVTKAHTRIRRVIIEESGELSASEVRNRMILREGGQLYPRTALLRGKDVDSLDKNALLEMAIQDQIKSLKRVYTKEGLFDAEISIEMEEIEPNRVDLHVRVQNAESYALGKVYVRGNKIREYSDIEDAFRSGFGFFGGVTKAEIEDAVEAVLMEYRHEGYYQTKIDFVSRQVRETKTIDVFLDIHESEKWEVEFRGNEVLSAKELMGVLTFEESGFVDAGEIAASRDAIQQAYISAGFYWAKVTGERVRGRAHRIIFTVREGNRAEIGEIAFPGIAHLSRDELRSAISSTEYSALGSGAYPQRTMIADDAAKIVDLYRSRGYLNADVTGWRLEQMPSNGRFRLSFVIREGAQSRFANRHIRYTDRAEGDEFDVLVPKPEQDTFSDEGLRVERAAITKQLRSRGFATLSDRVHCTSYHENGSVASEDSCEIAEFPASCMPDVSELHCELMEKKKDGTLLEICERHFATENDEEGGTPCELKNGVTGQDVDVEYEVTLGPKHYFGDVFIHGNDVTQERVVYQDILFARGDVYDFNTVIDSRSMFRRRKIYRSASLNAIGVDDELIMTRGVEQLDSSDVRVVPMVVNLEESERHWFDFAFGIQRTSDDWIASAEVEYVEANLNGSGWEMRLLMMPEVRFYSNSAGFKAFITKFNQNFFTLLTFSGPLWPRYGLNLVTQAFYDLRYIPDTNKQETGILAELQWNANKKWFSAIAAEIEHSMTSTFGLDVSDDLSQYRACYPFWYGDCPFNDGQLTFSLTPRVSYDGRDNPVAPKYGPYVEAKVKVAFSTESGWYLKPEAHASFVYTFLKYFSVAFNLRYGMSFMFDDSSSLPLIDRYFLGGLNMRGYDNEALGPRLVNKFFPDIATSDAGGGESLFNFTAELRYPIWTNIGLYGALFVDMGALTEHQPTYYSPGSYAEELFVNQMRYTAGLGLRLILSDAIPPIVLDYGFILNRRRGDPLGGFSLNVGYTF